jgi:hypothetical protein
MDHPMLVCAPSLGKVRSDGLHWVAREREEYLGIMIPEFGLWSPLRPGWLVSAGFLCGTSQIQVRTCYNLKNLAFPIEPPANPTRPTLRDGH